MRLLIAEDEVDLAEALTVFFEKNHFSVDAVHNGFDAYEYASSGAYDAVILDVMMPKMDGIQVLEKLRQEGVKTPIMMLTAKGQKSDRITGFNAGADDYLPKPFLPKELLLRVGAILYRTYPEPHRTVELAASTVDLEKAEVWKDGVRTPLTAKELQLFQKLYENVGRIVTTGILCETICGEFWQGYESTLSTHIRHLREKIEENPSKPVSLVTAKGLGYRLNLKGAKS